MFGRLVPVILAALLAAPNPARGDAADCTKALGKAVRSYVKSRQKAIAGCESRRSSGKLPASTVCRPQCSSGSTNPGAPCRTDADCPSGACDAVTDVATGTKLTKASDKVTAKITASCTGTLPPIGPACDGAADAAALAACLTEPRQESDVEVINVDTLASTIYDTVAPVDPSLVKCQAAISKEVGKYLDARTKSELKCHESVASGKFAGPCLDATAAAALAAALGKLDGGIRKKCTETQLAANAPPKLDFGVPCENYKLVTFDRDGATNNNSLPVLDRLIRCVADSAAAVADRMVDIAYPAHETSAFEFGVAAGDATDTSVIFWTRLPDAMTGGFLDVALDAAFTSGLQTVAVTSPPSADGTVKEEMTLLSASTVYFYRFRQGSETSAVGKVKTAPAPASTQTIRLGWTGDANSFFRPYSVLEPIRLLDPEAWLFIGDTIYGDDPRGDGVVAMTTDEYFGKYKDNREDASLRHLMAAVGTYSMWDDHEVRDDFAGAEPVFATRMAAGNFAFRRYNPIREDGGEPARLYRSFKWGSLAEFFLIDLRQYRSAKYTCCTDSMESGFVTTDDNTTCHMSSTLVIPDDACNMALATPGRTVLGAAQKAWLENGLSTSTAKFKFIMNGPPITNLVFQPYDFWIGYPEERDAILGYIVTNSIPNVVWLSTDLHGIVISKERVSVGPSQPVPEVVGGAIGMDPIFRELPSSIVPLLGTLPGLLTQITQFDIDRFNAALLTVQDGAPATAKIDFYDRSGAVIQSVTFDAP